MSIKELKTQFPKQTFDIEGERVTITPFKFKDFQVVFELIERYVSSYKATDTDMSFVSSLLENGGTTALADVATVIEISTGKTAEWLEGLTYDVVVALLVEIFAANKDFFQALGKRLNPQREANPAAPATTEAGTTHIASSSGQGFDPTTSES